MVGLHVDLHVDDGGRLVRRERVGEGVLQLPLPRRVGREGVARAVGAGLVEDHQLLGDLLHGRADPGLGLGPVAAAQAGQAGGLTPGVVADGVDLVGGDVEAVGPPVLEQQVVPLDPADGPAHHAAVAGHAVLVVHDVVADLEVVEEAAGVPLAGPGPPVGPAAAGEIGLGQHGDLGAGEDAAPLEGLHDQVAAGLGEVAVFPELEAPVAQQPGQAGGRAGAVGPQHHPVAVARAAGGAGGSGPRRRRRPAASRRRRPRPRRVPRGRR